MTAQQNIPKLRFPGFEGEWEEKRLGDVVNNRPSKYNPQTQKGNGSIKCIELEHLGSGTSQLLGYVDGRNSGSIKNKFNEGDVLFGKLRPYLKKYLVAPFDGVCSSEIWVLKSISISNDFLFGMIQTDAFIDLANQSSGSKMPRADWAIVGNANFLFPTLPEQTKIASFLSKVDEKLTQLKKKKELLEQYKKGMMQKIFSQEVRFKPGGRTDEKGEEFPDWEESEIGNTLSIGSGKDYKHLLTGTVPVFGTGGLMTYVDQHLYTGETVCIGRKGTIDKPMYFSGRIWTVDTLFFTHSFVNMSVKFVYYLFQTINWLTYNEASGVPSLSKTTIEKIQVNIPSLAEQTKIANFLSAIDKKINHTQTQIDKAEQWKKGLLQQMFV